MEVNLMPIKLMLVAKVAIILEMTIFFGRKFISLCKKHIHPSPKVVSDVETQPLGDGWIWGDVVVQEGVGGDG